MSDYYQRLERENVESWLRGETVQQDKSKKKNLKTCLHSKEIIYNVQYIYSFETPTGGDLGCFMTNKC